MLLVRLMKGYRPHRETARTLGFLGVAGREENMPVARFLCPGVIGAQDDPASEAKPMAARAIPLTSTIKITAQP